MSNTIRCDRPGRAFLSRPYLRNTCRSLSYYTGVIINRHMRSQPWHLQAIPFGDGTVQRGRLEAILDAALGTEFIRALEGFRQVPAGLSRQNTREPQPFENRRAAMHSAGTQRS